MARTALLILVGGRPVPNILTAQYLRPDLIVPIASHEAMGTDWPRLEPILAQLCRGDVAEPLEVDAFSITDTYTAVEEVLARYPDVAWTFNITGATKLMSIGAYEAGRQHGATVWYLDTNTRRVVSLAGAAVGDEMYRMRVVDYMAAYGRFPEANSPPPSSPWLVFATHLADQPRAAMVFRDALVTAGLYAKDYRVGQPLVLPADDSTVRMCMMAREAGMIPEYTVASARVHFTPFTTDLKDFMAGLWLELYAWVAARDAGCFDDYRYGLVIPGNGDRNELDLALTYSASLVIAECKVENKPFKTPHLDKLRSIASMLGGNFVGRMFITSQVVSDQNRNEYKQFCDKAKERQVVVVTGEQLGSLSALLCREAGVDNTRPTYARG